MPPQDEHDKPENLVEEPGEAERTARTLQEAADSNATLEGYFSINATKPPEDVAEDIESGADQRRKKVEKGGQAS